MKKKNLNNVEISNFFLKIREIKKRLKKPRNSQNQGKKILSRKITKNHKYVSRNPRNKKKQQHENKKNSPKTRNS